MTMRLKLLGASLGAVALMAVAGPASAAPIADCGTITTINGWQTAGGVCDIGDKRFTLIDTDLDQSPYTSDFGIQFLNNGLNYAFNGTTGITGTGDAAGDNEFISYSIEVLDPAFVITQISLDSNVSNLGGVTTVTKTISDSSSTLLDTLVSTDGSTDTSGALNHTFLYIRDDISVGLGDTLQGFNNSIVQSPVPEPASLGLLGLGLLGLGALARRRRG